MSNLSKKIRKLRKILQKNREKYLFITLIYADGSEKRMESNEAFLALDENVVGYRWDPENALIDDNFIGALLAEGPHSIQALFADGDDSANLPKSKDLRVGETDDE